ncbi:MAG TPA: hypothetical protein VL693_06425 [Vicinamibacterales bacterium]|jgi:hypothetical protein|nr:hypothetical protein [Vicinamibacterales bacterium]
MSTHRLVLMAGVVATIAVASFAIMSLTGLPVGTKPSLRTSWGEPDLQGIWTRDVDIPLERPAKYANQEFFSDAERRDLDRQISDIIKRDSTEERRARGTERDVNTEFAQEPFTIHLPVGRRTSLVVDPPDGRIPGLTPEAQKKRDAFRQFQLALLQPTEACKEHHPGCAGGKYGPVSPRRNETPPSYIGAGANAGINRANGPEDRTLTERCLNGTLPDFGNFIGGFSRIVQSPGVISIVYDVGPGVGRPRIIPITTAPHLPETMRQYWGDSRGHWEGDTLIVDVTNFSPKSDFQGSHEHLHLLERWTRIDADTIDYVVTIDDPTTWVRPWTARQELKKQSDRENRIFYEPRCHEGNYGLIALLSGARESERAFAEGRGADPATLCVVIGGCGGFVRGGFADSGPDADPFQSSPPRAP